MEKGHGKGLITMLCEGTVFEGSIVVPHNLHIDGSFKGNVETSEELSIGPTGVVQADIKAKSAIVSGKIVGNIMVEDRIELGQNASLLGDLKAKDLIIKEGAVFHGNSSMNSSIDEKV